MIHTTSAAHSVFYVLLAFVISFFFIVPGAHAECFGGSGNCGFSSPPSSSLGIFAHGIYRPVADVYLYGSTPEVEAGQPVYITWTGSNVDQCAVTSFTNTTTGDGGWLCLSENKPGDPLLCPWGQGSHYPTQTTTYTVTCRNTYGYSNLIEDISLQTPPATRTASVTVSVAQSAQADVISGTTSVSANPVVGTPATLSSTITNYGGTAATNFPNIFQIEGGSLVASQSLTLTPSGAANDSDPISASYTFTTSGTYRVRACADNNTSWVGSVAESNESNNCSDWTTVVVTGGTQCSDNTDNDADTFVDLVDGGCTDGNDNDESGNGITANLTANPTSVPVNGSSTLTWACTNSTSASITPFGTVTPTASGSRSTGALGADATFGLTCTGSKGTATDYETVTVRTPVVDIWADAYRVATNGQTTVHWTSESALTCAVSGPGLSSALLNGEQSVTITKQQEYEIDCEGATKAITINPAFNLQEF